MILCFSIHKILDDSGLITYHCFRPLPAVGKYAVYNKAMNIPFYSNRRLKISPPANVTTARATCLLK